MKLNAVLRQLFVFHHLIGAGIRRRQSNKVLRYSDCIDVIGKSPKPASPADPAKNFVASVNPNINRLTDLSLRAANQCRTIQYPQYLMTGADPKHRLCVLPQPGQMLRMASDNIITSRRAADDARGKLVGDLGRDSVVLIN